VGLLLFFGLPMLIETVGNCNPFEDCDTLLPVPWNALSVMSPVFSAFLGIGLYLVGAAHVSIAAATLRHKILVIWLPLLLIGATLWALTRGLL
jgi:hypothetical protein